MPIMQDIAAEEPQSVLVANDGAVSNVWLRRNIASEEYEQESGEETVALTRWVSDLVHVQLAGSITEAEATERFEELWEAGAADVPTLDNVSKRVTDAEAATSELADTVLELCDIIGGGE